MARSRNIKPGFFQNDKLAELNPTQRLLFIGLWTIADYKGCLEYRPKKIKAQLLPYDDLDIKPELIGLSPEFIRFYTVDGRQYIKIINFAKHQHPHKNEVQAGSDIPDITEQSIDNIEDIKKPELIGTKPDNIGSTPPLTLNPLTDSLNPLTENPVRDIHHEFLLFYDEFGLKKSPKKALEAYERAAKKAPFEIIMEGVAEYKTYLHLTRSFQQYPATWLNGEEWRSDYKQLMEQFSENNRGNNAGMAGKTYSGGKPTIADQVSAVEDRIRRGEI